MNVVYKRIQGKIQGGQGRRDQVAQVLVLTMQDSEQHVLLGQDLRHILVRWMRASMNDTVHIQIQMIKLGQQGIVRHNLVDFGITFGNPPIKLWLLKRDDITLHRIRMVCVCAKIDGRRGAFPTQT